LFQFRFYPAFVLFNERQGFIPVAAKNILVIQLLGTNCPDRQQKK